MTRTVIEERQMPFRREVDVFSRLMADRIIFLGTGVDDYIANIIQAQMLFLESTDPTKDIQIYINSPGGSVYAGLGIYDTMQYIRPDVATICTGMAASMGAVLLCAGAAGKRTGLKHSRTMIHQPLGGARGQASDIEITAQGDHEAQGGAVQDHRPPQRTGLQKGVGGQRPGLLDDCRRGQGLTA